jgi:hypothetical protein
MFLRGRGSQSFNSGGYGNVNHASGALLAVQGDAIRNITGWTEGHHHGGGSQAAPEFGALFKSGSSGAAAHHGAIAARRMNFDASRVVPTTNENRPVNMAVRYLIRARP